MQNYIGKINSPFENNESIDFAQLTISEDKIQIEFSCNTNDYSSVKVIFGVFNGLGQVALINCRISGMFDGAASLVKKYVAEFVFYGEFSENPSELFFDKVVVEIPGLLKWTKISSIINEIFLENKVTIKKPDDIKIYDSEILSIEFTSIYFTKNEHANNKITISENLGLRIKSKVKIDFFEYLKLIKELQKMFFIISNCKTDINDITFYIDNKPIELIFNNKLFRGKPSFNTIKMEFSVIKSKLNIIIEKWLNNKDLDSSIDLILEKSVNNELSRENYFLNNCFSLETYHRRFRNNKIYKPSKFKEIKKQILDSIERNDIKELVANNLAHINQPNFRKRLIDFTSDFELILPSEIDSADYIKKIVKTRNYLVHRGSSDNIFNKFDLLYCSIYLENIIKANILKSLEIDNDEVNDSLSKIGRKINGLYDSNKKSKTYL